MTTQRPATAAPIMFAAAFLFVSQLAAQTAASSQPGASSPSGTTRASTADIVDVPLDELGRRFRLVGKLRLPLGQVATVQGVVIEGPFKGYEGGPNLRMQRINGRATQESSRIPIEISNFGDQPKLIPGETYEIVGYETGGFVGISGAAQSLIGVPVQTTDHYFQSYFVAHRTKSIPKIVASPADFVDRVALIEGMAVSQKDSAWIRGESWMLVVDANAAWPAGSEGKVVEGFGTIRAGNAKDRFRLENGQSRLVRLEDQVGQPVRLRGSARSLNGIWWFNYRGVEMYVEDMNKLPGWSSDLHYRPVEISGTLDRATLPRIDQISEKTDRDLAVFFIVRKPTWKRLDSLLLPELANDPW